MREAADHLAHGRETLALDDLLLQLLLHGHIANGNNHARWLAFGIEQRTGHAEHGAPAAVVVPGAIFAGGQRTLAGGDGAVECR